ncbi:MAG: ABC transporter permease [Candidatus Bipolaricaulis sp.]|nr:ABC transporter permease [Candidatus Bipolaricaulis sp.]
MKRLLKSKMAAGGGIIVILILIACVLAPWVAPYSVKDFTDDLLARPSATHLFGTDSFGRDALSLVLHSGLETLSMSLLTLVISAFLGIVCGIVSGYVGGWTDRILSMVMQGIMSFPSMMVALLVMGIFGTIGRASLIGAISVTLIPRFSMILRGATIPARDAEYVTAAQALGVSRWRLLWRHVVPNLVTPMIVVCSTYLPSIILLEASLSFLGFGAPPDAPTWGRIVSEGGKYFRIAPWLVLFPGSVIAVTVIGFNLLGEGIRDVVDPRVRGKLTARSVR